MGFGCSGSGVLTLALGQARQGPPTLSDDNRSQSQVYAGGSEFELDGSTPTR